MSAARKAIGRQGLALWDLELYSEGRKFVARWEDVPDNDEEFIDMDLVALPKWLSEQVL